MALGHVEFYLLKWYSLENERIFCASSYLPEPRWANVIFQKLHNVAFAKYDDSPSDTRYRIEGESLW